MKPLHSYTRRLEPESASKLQELLESRDYVFHEVPYAVFAARKPDVNVVYYKSGKLVIQGKGTSDFVQFVLEPEILGQAELGYEAVHDPSRLRPRIGVDESGKGDFFGPLCVAGVYVNETVVKAWHEAGIRDSKNISSEKRVADLAKIIRKTEGCVWSVVPIGNDAYNRLYEKMRSVNSILAWGHARVIENLQREEGRMDPLPEMAISDQFARKKATVSDALMKLGKNLELVQRHKAESDVAVAAASILARHEFLSRLREMQRQYGMELPKGASAAVESAAKAFVSHYGFEALPQVAKMHFRTVSKIQHPTKIQD